ncbi:Gfo/Idh/MocA family protein [Pseudomonas brassicacearum]|uniref:Gfo/Idh/MocA family protein n=1 Tax=Pseudomonas brassicacearum TaxID=930166 RepID=UPI000577C0F1|nr:Gfo/Idh/MocA family oxidoreductase [Pseudomonas brassicacearum]ROM97966.1 myo-inositol 2-dehydrogenase [Pseudomonas brassicacearum]
MSIAVGLVGAGVMGSEHARILQEDTPGASLAGICDADPRKATAAGCGARIYSDPLEMIHSSDIDAVMIASPDSTHAELVMACLAAEKPVLCEKPLAVTAAQAFAIVELEMSKGRRLVQVGYMRRFDPAYRLLKQSFDKGEIGKPLIVHNVHRNPVAPEWMTGSMSISNAFVHEIDVTRWLLHTDLATVRVTSLQMGDPLVIEVTTRDDVVITSEINMNCQYGYHVHSEIVGENGVASLPAMPSTVMHKAGQQVLAYPAYWVPRFVEAYKAQTKAWVKTIQTGQPNEGASAWDGYVTTAVAEHIIEGKEAGNIQLPLLSCPSFYG